MQAVSLRQFIGSTLLLLSLAPSLGAAAACPPGLQEVCVVACFCAPVSQKDIEPFSESVNRMAASGLEEWLLQSRNTAAAGDVRGIPLNIRVQLEPYYDLLVLDSARYKVGDSTELNAANTMLQNPDVNAVTLIDIIVFRNADDALNNVALWAHELWHVQQYQQWGVREFSIRYTRDYDAVEAPAYELQRRVASALRKDRLRSEALP
ncbi:MAG TPA: DUF4157 domain-containing protein [Pseudomonas sp.]|nr:DUF4157 domain-containing protein [Pseudomonas sp.]